MGDFFCRQGELTEGMLDLIAGIDVKIEVGYRTPLVPQALKGYGPSATEVIEKAYTHFSNCSRCKGKYEISLDAARQLEEDPF